MRIVGWIGILTTLAMMAVCSYFNWAYQQTRGHGPEAAIALGAGAVLIDLFKSIFPLSVMRAWDDGKFGRMILPSLGFVFCFTCSIISELGFLTLNRGAVASERESVTLQYQAAMKDLTDSRTKLLALGNVRPVTVIEQALRGQRVDRFWTTSNSCTEPSNEAARQFCKSFFAATAELASSVESARLGKQIDGLKADVVRLKKDGGGTESDPQAKLLSRLLPWFALDQVTLSLSVLFPVAFEFVAAFGLTISTRLMQPRGRSAETDIDAQPVLLLPAPFQPVVRDPGAQSQIPLQPMRFGRDSDGSIIIDG